MQNVTLALANLFIMCPNYKARLQVNNDNIKICVNNTVMKQFK